MATTYRIAEVAQRSGFTPATLRYYEDIGLLTPSGRTAAGYRLYDDTSLDRLRFIGRAKQLGCSLDEVAELTEAWDGGRCGPVQERLRAAVDAKVAEAHAQIAELTTFTADLQRAAAVLSTHRPEGPCDDHCGCVSAGGADSVGAPVPLVAKADAGGGEPIACTLGAADMAGRLGEWQSLLEGVVARRPLDDAGLRLELGADVDVAEVARLAAAEQVCCRFFGFALVIDARGTALEVHAPADAADVVSALFG
ncbi:MAG TPA: MerR family transcriptional regulator [Acidimicrobiales bacterium]|nr:MerR family transcriptional regulator [Acidimicrobiales bacterium]